MGGKVTRGRFGEFLILERDKKSPGENLEIFGVNGQGKVTRVKFGEFLGLEREEKSLKEHLGISRIRR